jgi:hypothetical protein
MINKGVLVRFSCRPGDDTGLQRFLSYTLRDVNADASVTAWFAFKFNRADFGMVYVFADASYREQYLKEPFKTGQLGNPDVVFDGAPEIRRFDILADKKPVGPVFDTKGLLLTFRAKDGHHENAEQFLKAAEQMVKKESDTTAWFAIRLDDDEYGIFDVFTDSMGRLRHLVGQVPREMLLDSFSLFGSIPDLEMLDVMGEKVGAEPPLQRA